MDEDIDDVVLFTITPRKLRKWELMAIPLQMASAIFQDIADGMRDTACVILRHSEYEQMRHDFHSEAAYELETLISEVENGTAD